MLDYSVYEHNHTIIHVKNAGAKLVNGTYKFDRIDFKQNCAPVFIHEHNHKVRIEYDNNCKNWTIMNGYHTLYVAEVRQLKFNHELPPTTKKWECWEGKYKNKSMPQIEIVTLLFL